MAALETSDDKKNKNMNLKILMVAAGATIIGVLGGCETGAEQPKAESPTVVAAATPPTADTLSANIYAPDGPEAGTVSVKPVGKALVSVIDGYPVRVHEGGRNGDYGEARLKPGDHILHVGNVDILQGLNLTLQAEPGQYFALTLTYMAGGEMFWTPVIVRDAPNGPIVADKDGLLVGKSQTEAIKLLTASASRKPAPAQAQSDDKSKEALEARAKALFEQGAKAFRDKQPEQALQALDEALMLAPGFDSALALRGVVLGQLKQPKAALESLDEAIRVGANTRGTDDEWLHWPWLEKGLILLANRQPATAYEALSESIRLKPTVKALIGRSNLSFARGRQLGNQEKWDEAAPFFRSAQADAIKGLELQPDSVKLWSIRAGTHIMLNEHEQACSAMRKACELGNCSILDQYPQCKPNGS
jgi:tetratricopeptide (TPR) repeat protein